MSKSDILVSKKQPTTTNPLVVADRVISTICAASGKLASLKEEDISALCKAAQAIVLSHPIVLDLQGPVTIVGDLRGQLDDLFRVFETCGVPGKAQTPEVNWAEEGLLPSALVPQDLVDHTATFMPSNLRPYLFLGNYTCQGSGSGRRNGIDLFCLLLAYKVKFPNAIHLLRGHVDCPQLTRIYGFYDDVKRRYNLKLFKELSVVMECLPVCAVVNQKMFCVHAGLSPEITGHKNLDTIRQLGPRPLPIGDDGVLCDLLWSDPMCDDDPSPNDWAESGGRGVSFEYHPRAITKFLKDQQMDLVVRAHQIIEDGFLVSKTKQLVSLFTASELGGEFDNTGAVMLVEADLEYQFKLIGSKHDLKTRSKK